MYIFLLSKLVYLPFITFRIWLERQAKISLAYLFLLPYLVKHLFLNAVALRLLNLLVIAQLYTLLCANCILKANLGYKKRHPKMSFFINMVEGGGFEPPKLSRQIYNLFPLATREPLLLVERHITRTWWAVKQKKRHFYW